MVVNYTYCGGHFTIYTNIKSLYYIPETNVAFYVNYTSIKIYHLVGEVTVWLTINCGKFWKKREYQTIWPASWKIRMQVSKQQFELDMKQQTASK